MTYLKITNETETHHGLQYHDGLNVDIIPFTKEGSCVPGGIYFTTPEHICAFTTMGIYVREVTIPEDAEMVKDPSGEKWRASKVILGERRDLRETATWEYLMSLGADIHLHNDLAIREAAFVGNLEVVKSLVSVGANIHILEDLMLRGTSSRGDVKLVKYLVSVGADIHSHDDYALRWASANGHLEIVKHLVSAGANIHAENDGAMVLACTYKQPAIIQYLQELGVSRPVD